MIDLKMKVTWVVTALVLAACGGGSDPVPPDPAAPVASNSIQGFAATGAAISGGDVVAKCSTGSPITGKTAADGSFELSLAGGQTPPCLIQVTKGAVVLHSFAAAAGRLNVTPVTDLIVTKSLGSDAGAAFASFDAAKGTTIKNGLAAAKTYVAAQMTALTGGAQSGDPMTSTFKVGDADDKVLDNLAAALATAGKNLNDLRQGVVLGGSLVASVERGNLIGTPSVLATVPTAAFDGGPLVGLTGAAKCNVKVVKLNYKTIGVTGEPTNASGVMLVPTGTHALCTAPAGLIAYAKGTDVQKPRTLANPADPETGLLSAMYAAQGYVVVATDYLGFADSAYTYHPYLHADSEASSVIDSIRAARKAAVLAGIAAPLSGKVMLTGYSQGGHSSMAAHRAIERDHAAEINVVAGAHLAGPYNLSGSLQLTDAIAGYQFFVPYLVTAWQKVYGTLYASVADVFKAPYSTGIESLLPNPTLNYTTLIESGKLPYGPTPNQARDQLFTAEYIAQGRLTTSPLFAAAKKNDLLGWSPKSQLLLCGGSGDPTVPPAVHQAVMFADFQSRGLTNVRTVDVDAMVRQFYGVAGNAPGPDSPSFASYYGNYHGSYEPPFCHANAKGLFDVASGLVSPS